ncbi:c-type cytochrome [Microbulbifer sp. SAOS-129_SWC]|uniref:c-type cytochrome n=1 Tax=Microbulbifer sp. SAOS-129_SWC TaxID=3145235 RepID=UPI003218002A
MKHSLPMLVGTALCSGILCAQELPDRQPQLPAEPKAHAQAYLAPRALGKIPAGSFGDKVRYGYQLFVNTQQLRGKSVGNALNCSNCHMDAGRRANAAPMWAAYFAYPAYRKKNDKVNSYQERLQGCMTYSMNGKPPPLGSPELVALSAYSYWLAMGALMDKYGVPGPVPKLSDEELLKGGKRDDFPLPEQIAKVLPVDQRAKLPGRGYPLVKKPADGYSPRRGATVYRQHCQLCHGADGQGYASAGVPALPPLWGPDSFNWGAGMHRVNTAAYFIHENMPLGKSIQLTPQQAWDVAAYINAQERPQDPRYQGDVEKLRQRYHQHAGYYGQRVDGKPVLGSDAYPNFPQPQKGGN